MKRMIALDGAQGEGGGQILRSALSWDRSVWSSGLAPSRRRLPLCYR
ncbi:hypothetical protein C6K72_003145 [Shigella flexneri]|nr:hypothetical protein [Shigella flexneri]EFY4298982.1 hypothetical protein [Shigella flexneri]EFY4303038.1 hypothetical protein [Shigella flexneri]